MVLKQIILMFFIIISVRINAQSTASQQVSKFSIDAPQLNTIKTIWVYLPKSYKISKKSYPVIYMHDAQNLFDTITSYAGEWKIDEYLDTINKNESIIIGIEHGNEKRIDELAPFKHKKYGGGKGDFYLDFIIDTLKPKIDSMYRTRHKAKDTTIFGSSLGGLLSFYAAIKHPEIFGKAGVFSPSFWINPEIYGFVKKTKIKKTLRFYFLVGTEESETMVTDQTKMINVLKTKGVKRKRIINKIIEGGEHNEKFWSSYFGNAYQWLQKS